MILQLLFSYNYSVAVEHSSLGRWFRNYLPYLIFLNKLRGMQKIYKEKRNVS